MEKILNVGCGENIIPGAVNLDGNWNPKADWHADLENLQAWPGRDNSFDLIILSHVIEHIHNVLPMMEHLHDWAKPNARIFITCPHGASDDADEDPTHVRRMFPLSFLAFAQSYYHNADYGYRGDWEPERIVCFMEPERVELSSYEALFRDMIQRRNIVVEMYAELRAVKPIRDRLTCPQNIPRIEILAKPQGWKRGPLPK